MKENQLNEEQTISYNTMFKVMLNKKCQLTSLHASTHFSNQCSTQSVVVPDTPHKPNTNIHMFTKHWPSKAQNTKWKHQHCINLYPVSLIT